MNEKSKVRKWLEGANCFAYGELMHEQPLHNANTEIYQVMTNAGHIVYWAKDEFEYINPKTK